MVAIATDKHHMMKELPEVEVILMVQMEEIIVTTTPTTTKVLQTTNNKDLIKAVHHISITQVITLILHKELLMNNTMATNQIIIIHKMVSNLIPTTGINKKLSILPKITSFQVYSTKMEICYLMMGYLEMETIIKIVMIYKACQMNTLTK